MSTMMTDNTGRHVPVLIFRSASGRTEVTTRPDGEVRVHMLYGTDDWTREDVARLAELLAR